ncbi:MAG: recombinase family protein [Deltaproteobacteria bacterium]|nr:recombinase family protein [Deltaproteobacteria bacterium]
MTKRAIAYTSDIILGNTGEIIERAFQRKRIEQYAAENGVEIVAWFEDEAYNENIFARPRVKEMLEYREPYELVLVERTWAISRKWKEIRAMMQVLESKHARVEATTTLWDCVSQMARNYYRPAQRKVESPSYALEAERERESATIDLVKTYGRQGGKAVDRYVNVIVKPGAVKPKVRRPNRLAFQRIS